MSPRERAGLGTALVLAFALRIGLVLSLEGDPFFYEPIVDSAAYDTWAHEIATQDFIGKKVFYQDPLYPYGLGIFYAVFGRDLLWARLVQCLLGTLGLWMLFEGTRRTLGYRTAIVALAIAALYKTFVFFDGALLKDFLGVIAVEAAILFWSLDSKWKWLGFGAALGVGTLVRGNMLLLALAAAAFLAARREWKPALLTLAGAAACVAPATIRNLAVSGEFVPTTAQLGPNLYTGNNEENTSGRYRPPSFLREGATEFEEPGFRKEAERLNRRPMKASEIDAYWRGRAVDYITSHFGTFLGVTAKRTLMLLNAYEIPDDQDPAFMARFSWVLQAPLLTFGLFVAPLAAAGIYLSWAERGRFAMLYLLLAAYGFSIVFFFVFARYRMPLVPFLVIFAAHAIVKGAKLRDYGMRQVPRAAAAVFLVTLAVVNIPLPEAIGGHRDFRTAHANLGLYYSRSGKFQEAVTELEASAKLDPDRLRHAGFVWTLADASERSGQEIKAFEHYELASQLDPSAAEASYKVGTIYLHRDMHARALEKFKETIRRDPNHAAGWQGLADALLGIDRKAEAMEVLAAGTKACPDVWGLRLSRARLFLGLSMWREARVEALEVLRLSPNHAEAARIRDEAASRLR